MQSADVQINLSNTRTRGGNTFVVVSAVHRECERFIARVGTCTLLVSYEQGNNEQNEHNNMDITDSDNEIGGPMAVDRVGDRTSRNKPIPHTDRGEDAEAIPLATYVGDLPTGVLPGFPQRRLRTSCVLWNNPLVVKASGPIPKYPHRSAEDIEERESKTSSRHS